MSKKIPPELESLSEQIGEFIQYWGFKRIHGRIWTHLFLSEEPLDATELRVRLKVSKALISMSIGDLLEYEVVEEMGKSERGTLLYRANPNVTDVVLNVLRRRERKMIAQIEAAFKLLRDLRKEDKLALKIDSRQVKTMGEMIEGAEATLDALISMDSVSFEMLRQYQAGTEVT